MRKIPECLENPIDNVVIDTADKIVPYFKQLNFVPNDITTISLIISMFSIYLFYKDYNKTAAILFLIGYLFDCTDGYYARKYNMVSRFGDYYDHFCDISKLLMLYYIMYIKSATKFFKIFPLLVGLIVISTIHIGCQEYVYDEKDSPSLSSLKFVCINKKTAKENMKITRYFGFGTFFVIMSILIATY